MISVAALVAVFRTVSIHDVIEAVRGCNPKWLLLGVFVFLVSYGVRSVLWKVLLPRETKVQAPVLFRYLMMGLMANNLLPARLGEMARAYLAGRDVDLPRTVVFSSIINERLLDVFILLSFLSTAAFFSFHSEWPKAVGVIAGAALLAGFTVVALIVRLREKLLGILAILFPGAVWERLSPALSYYLYALAYGLKAALSKKSAVRAICLSLACWLLWILYLQIVLAAFDIRPGYLACILLGGIINLGVLVPSAPGYVGTFQFVCVKSLQLFGVSPQVAVAFSLVLHASWFIPTTSLGLVFLWSRGLGLKRLRNASVVN